MRKNDVPLASVTLITGKNLITVIVRATSAFWNDVIYVKLNLRRFSSAILAGEIEFEQKLKPQFKPIFAIILTVNYPMALFTRPVEPASPFRIIAKEIISV
jgi:hypothetical protein